MKKIKGYEISMFDEMAFPIMREKWGSISRVRNHDFFSEPDEWEFPIEWGDVCRFFMLIYDPKSPLSEEADRDKMKTKALMLIGQKEMDPRIYHDINVRAMVAGFLTIVADVDYLWLISAREYMSNALSTVRTPANGGLEDDKEATMMKNQAEVLLKLMTIKDKIKEEEERISKLSQGDDEDDYEALMNPASVAR